MALRIGVTLPEQDERLGPGVCIEPRAAWDFVQGVEEQGYDYLTVGDHVLGADISNRPDWTGMYDRHVPWHDSLVVLAYLAGATQRINLFTHVMVLPQRQTALVAKQAAEVDVISGGRLWLGVGAGWNQVEFEALGQDFSSRGRRMNEQIAVLRALWTQEVVTFNGQWHDISEAGLSIMPVQRPIPIWVGGGAEPVLRRVGQLADGWMPSRAYEAVAYQPTEEHGYMNESHRANLAWVREAMQRVRNHAIAAGRDPSSIRVTAGIEVTKGTPETWPKEAADWQDIGITHITARTRRSGLRTVDEHLEALQRYREEVIPVVRDGSADGGSPLS